MEGKAAETTQLRALAPAMATPSSMHEEQLLKEEAIAPMEQQQRRGWTTTAMAWMHWASVKTKARAASEYAALRTRQGITMFGEPKLGPLVKAAPGNEETQ